MGHITEMANLIKKATQQQEATICPIAKETKGWPEFVDGALSEVNLVNERQLGGPVPIGSSFPAANNIYSGFNNNEEEEDDDDDVYVEEEEQDSDDSDD